MYSKLAFFAAASMAVFVAAIPTSNSIKNSCKNAPVQCCNSSYESGSKQANDLLGLLGIVAEVTALVGVDCSPITAIGASGTSCNAQAVCCSDNSFFGVVALGCTPVHANA